MKKINATINTRGMQNIYIANIIQKKIEVGYDPSYPAAHIVLLDVDDVNLPARASFFVKTLDINYIKHTDSIVFVLPYEGWSMFIEFLHDALIQFCPNLDPSQIYYATELLNLDEVKKYNPYLNSVNHLSFIAQNSFMFKKFQIPHDFNLKDKIFLSYNRKLRSHRCRLVSAMSETNMLKESLISFNHSHQDIHTEITATNIVNDDTFLTPAMKFKILNNLPKENLIIDPYEYDDWMSPLQMKKNALHHLRSMFSIVTETFWYEPEISFTEKIYRPLSMGHPFIVLAPPFFLKKLREFGFKTFSPMIDEKYDEIVNPHSRFEHIIGWMKYFYDLPENEKETLWNKCNEIAEYNYNIFHKNSFNENKSITLFTWLETYAKS